MSRSVHNDYKHAYLIFLGKGVKMNDDKEQARSQENAGGPQPCCDGGSCCPSDSDAGGKNWKIVVFVLIVIAAGVVLARSLINRSNSGADQTQETFAAVQPESGSGAPSPPSAAAKAETVTEAMESVESPSVPVVQDAAGAKEPEKAAPNIWGPELDSIASLNQVATDVDAVFVFLAAEGAQDVQPITGEIEAAARKIQSKGSRISAFTLKKESTNYAQLAKQFSTPCVVAMVKGHGMSAVSGQITESKLIQAFVTASRARSACCPGGGPCGPKSGKPKTK